MSSFFRADGPLMNWVIRIGNLILANVLWLLCCLPIVTIVPASTSFYYTVIKCVRRERSYVTTQFIQSMKRTLRRGILLSLLCILWMGWLCYGREYAIANGTDSFNLLLFAYDILLLLSSCVIACLIPVFSRYELRIGALLRLSFVMALRYLYRSLPLVAGAIATGWLVFAKLPVLFIVVLPGAWCYASTYLVEPMLKAYMPKEDEVPRDAWYRE